MIRRPPRSTRTDTLFPTRRSSDLPEFADRKTEKLIDGQTVEGWFTEDFTLAELKTLRARERLPRLRSTDYDGRFEIPTFEEILTLLAEVNRTRDKPVGVYPENKDRKRDGEGKSVSVSGDLGGGRNNKKKK